MMSSSGVKREWGLFFSIATVAIKLYSYLSAATEKGGGRGDGEGGEISGAGGDIITGGAGEGEDEGDGPHHRCGCWISPC